jgi:hypothetical protein
MITGLLPVGWGTQNTMIITVSAGSTARVHDFDAAIATLQS